MNQPNLNGLRVTERRGNTIFVSLPRELWRLCGDDGVCRCAVCTASGRAAYWDTLAVATEKPRDGRDYTWTCHHPSVFAYDPIEICDGEERFERRALPLDSITARPLAGHWSVLIPWSATPTEWHPTERTGPLSVLVRGAFKTEGDLIAWCERHIPGHPYTKRFTVSAESDSTDPGGPGCSAAQTGPDGLASGSGPSPIGGES